MKVHGLIALSIRAMLHETGVAALDLDTTSRFLLNVLDIGATMTDYLCSEVEAWDWFKVNGYAFFWPFALQATLADTYGTIAKIEAYPSKLITLHLVWLSTSEAPLIHQVRKFLPH